MGGQFTNPRKNGEPYSPLNNSIYSGTRALSQSFSLHICFPVFIILDLTNNCADIFVLTGLGALVTMTSFMMMGCIIVLVVKHLFINLQLSSALVVDGLLSLRVSLEPLTAA